MRRLVVLVLVVGCASAPPPRFAPGPAIRVVHDDADIALPTEDEYDRYSETLDNYSSRQLRLWLDPVPGAPAQDVDRFGQIPDSSWYQNRIDHLAPDDVGKGVGGDDPGPEAHFPWSVVQAKVGGVNPGFVIEDARGERYLCKFDRPAGAEISTAAGAVAPRLFWALGYHVPDDRVVHFRRSDLRVAEGAVRKVAGSKLPLTDDDLDAVLASVPPPNADGAHRALVSRYLSGRPVGGFLYRGTRSDDPNDTIAHENRRSLRGMRVFAAWLNHVDLKPDNTLDVHVEEQGRRFLRHHYVDFDGTLGAFDVNPPVPRVGYAYGFDLEEFTKGLFALGLSRRTHERIDAMVHPLIQLYTADPYEPSEWKANYAIDYLSAARPADLYWAGTVLAKVTDAMCAAAARAARFSDPTATAALTDVLIARRDLTVRWARMQVTPVEDLALVGDRVAARVDFGLDVSIEVRDRGDTVLWSRTPGPDAAVALSPWMDGRDYLVVRWTAHDGPRPLPPTEAHYGRDDRGRWSLWGILRDGE